MSRFVAETPEENPLVNPALLSPEEREMHDCSMRAHRTALDGDRKLSIAMGFLPYDESMSEDDREIVAIWKKAIDKARRGDRKMARDLGLLRPPEDD